MVAVVEVSGLEKSYALGATQVEVLRGVDLTLSAGEIVAVMGPSGAGKSTLLNCVSGLDRPDRGVVRVLDQDLGALDELARTKVRRRTMGIVYQFFNLVPNLDVYENVLLPFLIDDVRPAEREIEAALERVGMSHRARHLPSQLSGGEMQLVSIARALVRRPRLVLADEPTGNVNVATGRRIMTLLREVVAEVECAMLLVTHNPEDAQRADRVVFMQDGRLDRAHVLEKGAVSLQAIHARLLELEI